MCMVVKHSRVRGRSRPRSGWRRKDTEPWRPSPVARARWHTAASRLAALWRGACASGRTVLKTPPAAHNGAQRRALAAGAPRGHALALIGGEQWGVPGAGDGRWSSALRDLAPHRTGDTRAGGAPCRHDPRGCRATLHTALAESCGRGHGAHGRDGPVTSGGDALAVAAPPALQSDAMGIVAAATAGPLALWALPSAGAAGSRRRAACGGRRGRCVAGSSPALGGPVGTCARCSRAAVTAVEAARSVVARGPATALPSAGCPGPRAGAGWAAREGAPEANRPGAAALVACMPRPWRGARAGAIQAGPRPCSRAGAHGAPSMPWLSGSRVRRPRPPGHVASWVTVRSVGGLPGATRAVAVWPSAASAASRGRLPCG